ISLLLHAIFARPVTPAKLYPRTALALLTALNLLNYIDRSVLFAVQDLVKAEFHRSDAAFGLLTSVFFIFYMCAAPSWGRFRCASRASASSLPGLWCGVGRLCSPPSRQTLTSCSFVTPWWASAKPALSFFLQPLSQTCFRLRNVGGSWGCF